MQSVIDKTNKLINVLEDSEMIKNLEHYKHKVINNDKLFSLINKYNNTQDKYIKISLKEEIYKYEEYKEYMKYYNELFYYILKINNKFREYTNEKSCNI